MIVSRLALGLFISTALISTTPASGHLLPKGKATVKLKGEKAYLAITVPVSALGGVDDNGDSALSNEEISSHHDAITLQFKERFQLSSDDQQGSYGFVWVTNPADSVAADQPHLPTDYVIIMAGVAFSSAPNQITVETDLFAKGKQDDTLSIRASRKGSEQVQVATLSASSRQHTFFVDGENSGHESFHTHADGHTH